MAFETYVRVSSGSTDPIDINRQVADIAGYIGSYIVDLDEEPDFSFDILVGFQSETEDGLNEAVQHLIGLVGDGNVREFRNRDEVIPTIGGPGQLP
jgi:hypothetical protein